MKKTLLLASVLWLSACAGTNTRDGLVYRDGSWYSPAREGHGDYYTGRGRHAADFYDVPWAWSVGFVPFGGYCPIAYRYCTSFWADPWFGAAWYPGYYPYYPYPHVSRHPRNRAPTASLFEEDAPIAARDPATRMRRDPEERLRPPPRERGAWGGTRGARGDEGSPRRSGRRSAGADGGGD